MFSSEPSVAAEIAAKACRNFSFQCQFSFTFFDGIQLVGRFLSATADLVTIVLLFLIGRLLFSWKEGLIAAFLMAVAVLPIQQSHFFTMDNWAAALTTSTLYNKTHTRNSLFDRFDLVAVQLGLSRLR